VRSHRAAAIVALALVALGCRAPSPSPGPPDARAFRPRVTIESPSGRSSPVDVEVARTPAEVERGLMFRRELAPDAGMIFVFDDESEHVFWMKNTFIPLDMLFIDAAGRVISIAERTVPHSLDLVAATAPARAVLEVNGGTAARLGIKPGDRVVFPIFGNAS
jgi:uncharacterized membrane protein (UPF0127 family)